MLHARSILLVATLLGVSAPALAQFRDSGDAYRPRPPAERMAMSNQSAATKDHIDGTILPFDTIRNRVGAQVGGKLIASDYEQGSRTYRMRYMRNGAVVIVDVDARSGNVIRREGF